MRPALFVVALLLVACSEDLGIRDVRFTCTEDQDCADGLFCSPIEHACLESGCGDGIVQFGEECDIGHDVNDHGCTLCKRQLFVTCSSVEGSPSVCATEKLVSIAAGEAHLCGITESGIVRCEGTNLDHDQNFEGQATPPSDLFDSITAGIAHTCGIKKGGKIGCWGSDLRVFAHQDPYPSGMVSKAPVSDAVYSQISAGGYHTCALKQSATIDCWGADRYHQSEEPQTLTAFSISSGYEQSCAVRADSLRCWGGSTDFPDGVGTLSNPPAADMVKKLSLGWYHACFIAANETIQCWGTEGEVIHISNKVLTPPDGHDFFDIACGRFHCCALHTGGTAECWGEDSEGGLDFETYTPKDEKFTQIVSGPQYSCGLREDGTVHCFGKVFEITPDE